MEVSGLYNDAAQHVMQMVYPYIYAAYLYTSKQHKNLQSAIALSIKSKNLDNQKWAHNLMGSFKHEKGSYEAAVNSYK